jgi:hypothetical protein
LTEWKVFHQRLLATDRRRSRQAMTEKPHYFGHRQRLLLVSPDSKTMDGFHSQPGAQGGVGGRPYPYNRMKCPRLLDLVNVLASNKGKRAKDLARMEGARVDGSSVADLSRPFEAGALHPNRGGIVGPFL